MATVRHLALNILEGITVRASLKLRRKTLVWDDDYLLAAFTESPDPSSDSPARGGSMSIAFGR
jgi:hypothetical protein